MRNKISLREKTLKRKNIKTAITLILVTLAILIAFAFFGITIFARFASFIIDLRTTPGTVEVDDQTPPPPPTLDDLPSATNQTKIEIKGRSQPGNIVILYLNNDTQEVITNREGVFSHTYNLKQGNNTVEAAAKSGNPKIKMDDIDTNVISGKKLRRKLLMLLRDNSMMKYSEISDLRVFRDVKKSTLRQMYYKEKSK